jgi:hypothetical protein
MDGQGCQFEPDDLMLLLGQRHELRTFASSL